jgi:hypothetical protein
MASMWVKWLSAVVSTAAVTGGVTYARHRQRVRTTPDEGSSGGLTSSALTLTSDIVDGIFRDDDIMNLVGDVVVRAFLHPEAVDAVKNHFQHEFTENDETVGALKTFIVDKVILDKWVSDHLVEMSVLLGGKLLNRPEVWPTGTCDLLKDAALEALVQEQFLEAAKNHAYVALSTRNSRPQQPSPKQR